MTRFDQLHESLGVLRETIPQAVGLLKAESRADLDSWVRALDSRVLPRLAPGFPLLAAICGGGSTGKSTLFNTLLGERLSPTGGKAGINRRILAAVHPDVLADEGFVSNLFDPFGEMPKPLRDAAQLTQPGCPLYVQQGEVPPSLVLLDTPDFDTGLRGEYVNRPLAQPVLQACDVLIYIFTNATYNNRDNTNFMADVLTKVGKRKCILVYRCYASFSDVEVYDHAMTVAGNLYGGEADELQLGVYRADDSNDVAAGRSAMQIRSVWRADAGILEMLGRLDPRETREEVNRSVVRDVLKGAREAYLEIGLSLEELALYRDMIKLAQSHCVKDALKHFPLHEVTRRTNDIWRETSPAHVKAVRTIGNVAAYPGRKVLGLARWIKERKRAEHGAGAADPTKKVQEDLVAAASELRWRVIARELTGETTEDDPDGTRMRGLVEGIREGKGPPGEERPYVESAAGRVTLFVDAHRALDDMREQIRARSWKGGGEAIQGLAGEICRPPEAFDEQLRELVAAARAEMKFAAKVREYISAYLGVVPPTLALVYILGTGDVATGAGVHAKLTGLFGLHDLAAVVALPASTGLDLASRKKLEERLKPLVERWFDSMSKRVAKAFEEQVTGSLIQTASEIIDSAGALHQRAREAIQHCESAGVE